MTFLATASNFAGSFRVHPELVWAALGTCPLLTRLEVARFRVFRAEGPAVCLAQSAGLGIQMNLSQGPKVRQIELGV